MRKKFFAKAALTLIAALFGLTEARAETLTVYDGTETSQYVPASIYRINRYTRSQVVIPATALELMDGGSISAITFYSNRTQQTTLNNIDVYVTEVDNATISSFIEKTSATTVHSGTLIMANGELTIEFSAPFSYNGGNLLVGIENTSTGTRYNGTTFYGQTVSSASVSGDSQLNLNSVTATQRNFIPKTTFTYTPSPTPKPTDLAVTDLKVNSATIEWNGTASSYNLRYAPTGSTATIIMTAHDVWGDGSGYQMLLDADANAYGNVFTSNGGWTASDYSAFEYTVPVNADCSVNATYVVADGSVTIQIPAGTYDWCITNPTPGDKIYIASSSGNVGGRQDDYVFEGGKTYEFNITLVQGAQQSTDNVDVTITDNSTIAGDAWTTVNNVTSPYTLENLSASTTYRVEVQAVYSGGVSKWAGTNFTTLAANHVVTDVAVTPQSTTANISWVGESDSYQIQYKKKATVGTSTSFFEDFENGLEAQGWTTIRNGEGTTNTDWHQFDATNFGDDDVTNHGGNYGVISRSWASDAYSVDNWLITPQVTLNGMLKYWVRDDGGYHEHYDIYVSTTTADISAFEKVYEPGNASSTWTEVSVDLSSYAGQPGYIAFRNTDYDQDFLLIDDVGLYEILSPAGGWMTVTTTETSIELTALVPDTEYEFTIIGIKDGVSNSGTPIATFTTLDTNNIELANNNDNTDLIEALDGLVKTVKLAGRTFKKNGNWNSICLPFDVTLAGSPLEGAEVGTLSSTTTLVNDKLTVRVDPITTTTLTAGTPYLLRWGSGDNIVEPEFENVTITKEMHDVTCDLGGEKSIAFKGNYNALKFTAVDESILFINNNKVYYVGVNSTINAQRAYFKIEGVDSGSVKQMVLDLGEDDPTGIEGLNADDLNEPIYNVAGQRLNKMQKGINIVNGKKILF